MLIFSYKLFEIDKLTLKKYQKININKLKWKKNLLLKYADTWLNKIKIRIGPAQEDSLWWIFVYEAKDLIKKAAKEFIEGSYKFNPMNSYTFDDKKLNVKETIIIFNYIDRLVINWILQIIKPVFKHIIHFSCYHLKGANGVKAVVSKIKDAMQNKNFRYFIRADIRGYYASIDRKILTSQVKQSFNDQRIIKYLEDLINIPLIRDATFFTSDKGLPIRGSLSPFFSALYLYPLDLAFEKVKGVYYFRFCDDILILAETKIQFLKAKRRLRNTLSKLKLVLSKHKTKMGALTSGFHFLGVNFSVVPQSQQKQSHLVVISIHTRSCRRALDNILRMRFGAVYNPAFAQVYLSRWARWWGRVGKPKFGYLSCLSSWVKKAQLSKYFNQYAWLGSGLIKI